MFNRLATLHNNACKMREREREREREGAKSDRYKVRERTEGAHVLT